MFQTTNQVRFFPHEEHVQGSFLISPNLVAVGKMGVDFVFALPSMIVYLLLTAQLGLTLSIN